MLKMPCARVALLAVCLGALLNACAGDKGKRSSVPNGEDCISPREDTDRREETT